MKSFTVFLTRTLTDKTGERIQSSLTVDISADSRDEAAASAEKEFHGWHVSKVAI